MGFTLVKHSLSNLWLIYLCFISQAQKWKIPLFLQKSLATGAKEEISALCPREKMAEDSKPQTETCGSCRRKILWNPNHIQKGLYSQTTALAMPQTTKTFKTEKAALAPRKADRAEALCYYAFKGWKKLEKSLPEGWKILFQLWTKIV